ncbi:class I SAM-dependent methyltransferase [Methylosinus trichosporium]|uniref:Class I SAM-dependent methyltransferase n=1 Tax=Methylosinus trichosporium (strain ATCC 35070 / NCIMB 11131 / UNIQEM 75 / OB3b) TaxID=595536 RepID=A0A2D2D565_METT3|nr:class I SAM-dependent methyltransferase [Methylosinus trichosporium]ATQ70150.1 class I SAM-dependent methyltransferase [Methylosinus trichosporium OB3b]
MSAPADAIGWHDRFGARFADRYRHSAAFRERLRIWSGLVDAHVRRGDAVLDAGCGPGALACVAAQRCAEVAALDASANMIALARQRAQTEGAANIAFHLGAIGDPQLFAGRRFDAILCSSVLEYIDDLDGALDWLAARLAPGGVLLVSMPNGRSLYRRAERIVFALTGRPRFYAFVRHVPTRSAFAQALGRHGLEMRAVEFYAAPRLLRLLVGGARGSEHIEPLLVAVAVRADGDDRRRTQEAERPRAHPRR